MKYLLRTILLTSILTVLYSVNHAQTPTQPTLTELQNQIVELEAKLKAISVELAKLKQANSVAVNTVKDEKVTVDEAAPKPPAANKGAEPQKKKDLGVDIGSARLTPYGTIFFNAFGNSGGTNNADVPIFATPTGSGNTSASVRQTRLGVKIEGARVGKARLGAVIEGDFFGGFPSVGIGENFGIFRVRLAYARLDWERTSVTAGQDWMVFAPVNPTSIATAGNPQMAAAGNNWARLPQVRVERKIGDHITWQGALLEPQTGDFATNAVFSVQPTSGAASRLPFIQTRIAFADKNWFGAKKAGSIGVSGHYGRSRVFTGSTNVRNDIESVGLALDWNFALSKRVSASGEAFLGRNLGGFQAGIFQSYNNDFAYRVGSSLVRSGVRAIGTRGGWMQLGFTLPTLQDRLTLYGSVGIDDPDNQDLVSFSSRDWRSRNFVLATNFVYKFTPQFSLGAEFRRLRTDYVSSGRRQSNHVNLGASYSF
ncbi:MAG: hypothetical protein IPG58_20110 [Acidobacteria bacterium]|nr:hypothetical protein [Acidobacteriota bacterium]